MKTKLSVLQLKDIHLLDFKLEENVKGRSLSLEDTVVDIDFQVGILEKDGETLYGLKVKIKVNEHKKNVKIKVKSDIMAVFKFTDTKIEETKKFNMLLYNGLSIVYGFFRGIVFQKCSYLPPSDRMLPILNLYELIDSKTLNNKEKDSIEL